MGKRWRLWAWGLVVILLLSLGSLAVAGFGDFSGSSDFGSSSDSGSSWSSDSGSSWSSSDDSLGGSLDDFFDLAIIFLRMGTGGRIFTLALLVGLVLFFRRRAKRREESEYKPQGASPAVGLSPVSTLLKDDPDFSQAALQARLSKLFMQMQTAWTKKDISALRGDFTDAQFAQYDGQLQKYRTDKQTNYVERVAVLEVSLQGTRRDETHDILVARLRTRFVTYTLDDETGKQVWGDRKAERFMVYEWTLIRPRGRKTAPEKEKEAFHCPNCAAPMNINQSARCPYCQAVVSKGDYDWVISGIKALSQTTGR